MKKFDTQEINQLIAYRRSVYPVQFSGQKIEEAIIEQMLENANWAPNHGRTQPWRFSVFTDNGLATLANFQSELYKKVATAQGTFDETKFQKLATQPLQCSHIISIGMQRQASGRIPEIEEIEAVACAVQNMWLTAAAYGVGCYWGSGGITYYPEALEFFGLNEGDKLLGFLYLGKPKGELPAGRATDYREKVRWVR